MRSFDMTLQRASFFSRISMILLTGLALGTVAQGAALFNGQNLQGWRSYLSDHAVGMRQVWSVQDGILICRGQPMGYLYTRQAFTDFKLTLEWRWPPGVKPSNSGVLFRINGKPAPLPRAVESQLKSGDAGDLYGFHGMKIDGDPARLRSAQGEMTGELAGVGKIKGNEKPAGEWNVMELLVKGPAVTVWVNGEKVNEATGVEVANGPIGLQSEGGEIHFRTVKIEEITP